LETAFDFVNDVEGKRTSENECPDLIVGTTESAQSSVPQSRRGSWPDLTIRTVEQQSAGEFQYMPQMGMPLATARETDEINGVVGVQFGFSFKIDAGDAKGMVRVRYRRTVPPPGLSDRRGSELRTSVESDADCLLGQPCVIGFQFEREDEVVAGLWHFEVFYRGFKLTEHTFNVGVTRAK